MNEYHELPQDGSEMRYDSTGMFHWCTPRRIAEAQMTKEQCAQLNLQVMIIDVQTDMSIIFRAILLFVCLA